MHPVIRILGVMLLAILVQVASVAMLMLIGGVVVAVNLYVGRATLFRLLRRSRWLILMLLTIYAFATPGEYVAGWPFAFAPTHEGLQAGVSQAIRLGIMLGGIALLLSTTTRRDLIAGIYLLLLPFRYFGISPEKFAARLWLTLHYVEQQPIRNQWQGWRSFSLAADPEPETGLVMLLDIPPLRIMDWSIAVMMCAFILWWSLS